MERRSFLKGIFGAAVVATMPKLVVDKIETLPPPPMVEEMEVKFVDRKTNIKVATHTDDCVYLYKNDHLLGYSNEANIEVKIPRVDISSIDKSYREYVSGPGSWSVSMKHIKWLEGWGLLDELLLRHEPVVALLKKGDNVIHGECLIVERQNMWLGSGWVDIKLQGTGQLILENDKNS